VSAGIPEVGAAAHHKPSRVCDGPPLRLPVFLLFFVRGKFSRWRLVPYALTLSSWQLSTSCVISSHWGWQNMAGRCTVILIRPNLSNPLLLRKTTYIIGIYREIPSAWGLSAVRKEIDNIVSLILKREEPFEAILLRHLLNSGFRIRRPQSER